MPDIDSRSALTTAQQDQLGEQPPSIEYRAETLLVKVADDEELKTALADINNVLDPEVSGVSAQQAADDLPRRIVVVDKNGPVDVVSVLTKLRNSLPGGAANISLEHVVNVSETAYTPGAPPPRGTRAGVDQGAYTISTPPGL